MVGLQGAVSRQKAAVEVDGVLTRRQGRLKRGRLDDDRRVESGPQQWAVRRQQTAIRLRRLEALRATATYHTAVQIAGPTPVAQGRGNSVAIQSQRPAMWFMTAT